MLNSSTYIQATTHSLARFVGVHVSHHCSGKETDVGLGCFVALRGHPTAIHLLLFGKLHLA